MPEQMTKQDAIEYLLYMKHDVQAKSPMDIALDTAIEALKQPTIEPEVRYGRWIVNDRNPDYADCTNCGLSEWLGANGSRDYAETLLSGFKKFRSAKNANGSLRLHALKKMGFVTKAKSVKES